MRLHWQNSIQIAAPIEQVYAYLADFTKHHEWSRTLERMEKIQDGDGQGIGVRYLTHERIEFPPAAGWRRRVVRSSTGRTICEVRALVPPHRIAWHAHPIPRLGAAELCFELLPSEDGGTIITQTVQEYYPAPIALLLRVVYNVTVDGIKRQLDTSLQYLKTTLDGKQWDAGQAETGNARVQMQVTPG